MRTWEDYKNHVKSISKDEKRNMEEIEEISAIVSSIIGRRQELGMSQRALAERCGIPSPPWPALRPSKKRLSWTPSSN